MTFSSAPLRKAAVRKRFLAAVLFSLSLVLGIGCATLVREVLRGDEAKAARDIFSAMSCDALVELSGAWDGSLSMSSRNVPFVLGFRSGTNEETAGLYDPLGREIAVARFAKGVIVLSRGPAFEAAGGALDRAIPPEGRIVPAPGLSLASILSGRPGTPIPEAAYLARGRDNGVVLSAGRLTLVTDPTRTFLARADYSLGGTTLSVDYPDRVASAVPSVVEASVAGAKVALRRESE